MGKAFINVSGDDSISKYFRDVRKSELLTPEQEVNLAIRIQEGDEVAINELVMANLKFVISVAKDYQGQGLALADLISEGNLGLVKAAKRYDHTRGFRFISYAVWWVKQAIIQSLNDNARIIRLPSNVINKLSQMKKEIEKFKLDNEREPSFGEVYDDEGNIVEIFSTPSTSSLNETINEEGNELQDILAEKSDDDSMYDVDETVKDEINIVLNKLSDREREIIVSYFGIGQDNDGMTLEAIGDKYDLTKERIRQIKEKAIRKIRHNAHGLFDALNQ